MSGILVVGRTSAADGPGSETLRCEALAQGLSVSDLSERVWLGAWGPRPPKALVVGPWRLIGDVFNRVPRPWDPAPAGDSYEHKMLARFWGRYLGVRLNGRGEVDAALRDPSGAFECVSWAQDGLILIASETPEWLVRALRPNWRIADARLYAWMRDPLLAWADLLLDGPSALLPGTMRTLVPAGSAEVLWTPGAIARQGLRQSMSDAEAAQALVSAVDTVVADYGPLGPALGVEVSGGLDSSIVAASIRQVASAEVRLWLNAYGPDPEADERAFVLALATELGVTPTFAPRPTGRITEADLMAMSGFLRPGLNALDTVQDRDWATRARDAGITALLTGKGGDSLLVQAATSDVFSDLWRQRGWRAALSPVLGRLARENDRTVWSLIGEARAAVRKRAAFQMTPNRLLAGATSAPAAPAHPWLADLDDLGPAKRYQIAGLLNGLTFQAPSAQTEVVDLLHPLLAQPVVEVCLSLPTPQLTLGRGDRALARLAFADRLPQAIAGRRSKGEMTGFYGRRIADSLDVLRPWLLEGSLAARGLIDRQVTEQILTREHLIWRGGYGDIMVAAALEGWLRVWTSRLGIAPSTS